VVRVAELIATSILTVTRFTLRNWIDSGTLVTVPYAVFDDASRRSRRLRIRSHRRVVPGRRHLMVYRTLQKLVIMADMPTAPA
jgi:hypothetical protein